MGCIFATEQGVRKIKHKGSVKLNADDVWNAVPPNADEEEEQDVVLAEVEAIKMAGSDL